ncbi:MAG: homoserine dehydrogenase [Pseudomonadota bacterium]
MAERMGVGIAGLGVVGASLVPLLAGWLGKMSSRTSAPAFDHLAVTGISARTRGKDRGFDARPYAWFDDPVALATAPSTDIFVEVMGGAAGPALEAVTAALEHGKHVVTANKAMLADHGLMLARLAEEKGGSLSFEAAVAGAVPIIRTLKTTMAPCGVTSIIGILNGTCNYILSEMETKGLEFEEALAEAQEKGYAEADPTLDVGGGDAAQKLKILAALCFHCWPSTFFENGDADPRVDGITEISTAHIQYAKEFGFRIRLLGMAQPAPGIGTDPDLNLDLEVAPFLVSTDHGFVGTVGPENRVVVAGTPLGTLGLSGPGAGGGPTASAVAADLAAFAHGPSPFTFGRAAATLQTATLVPPPGSARQRVMIAPAKAGDQAVPAMSLGDRLADHRIAIDAASSDRMAVVTAPISRSTLDDALATLAEAGTPMSALRIADI